MISVSLRSEKNKNRKWDTFESKFKVFGSTTTKLIKMVLLPCAQVWRHACTRPGGARTEC